MKELILNIKALPSAVLILPMFVLGAAFSDANVIVGAMYASTLLYLHVRP